MTLKNTTAKDLARVTIVAQVSGSAKVLPRVKKIKKVSTGRKATYRLRIITGDERSAKVRLVAKVRGKKVATSSFRVRTDGSDSTSLVGRYFFHKGINSGGDRELYFGNGFVNEDVPSEAYAACSAASAVCQPYTYDPASGTLTVGEDRAQVSTTSSGFTLGGDFFQEAALVEPGTRYGVTLESSYLSASCPSYGCYSLFTTLTLGADGSYDETSTNYVVSSTRTGTYEVISGSRVLLRYVDDDGVSGEEIRTFGVVLDDTGKADPVNEGLVLAGAWFLRLE